MNEENIRTLIETINSFMTSDLPDAVFVLVLRRLESFGYIATEEDAFGVAFSVQKSEINIKHDCNISEIPEGLYQTLCDMACADFLLVKSKTGKLDVAALNIQGALASVSLGDISVSFDNAVASGTNFDALISALSTSGRGDLECYRRIKW